MTWRKINNILEYHIENGNYKVGLQPNDVAYKDLETVCGWYCTFEVSTIECSTIGLSNNRLDIFWMANWIATFGVLNFRAPVDPAWSILILDDECAPLINFKSAFSWRDIKHLLLSVYLYITSGRSHLMKELCGPRVGTRIGRLLFNSTDQNLK
jgi:hypothetical protein